jgi:dCTP deaminase
MLRGDLIRDGIDVQIGPSCYELRMGSIYYDLTEGDKRIDASGHGTVLIKPGHRVVLITEEQLAVPHDIVARVTSKGSLFSVGLTPVSTYADPGFTGNLGIVTQNVSDKYIVLPIGESIAKIDFSNLSGSVRQPYRGQHGYQTKIWPIKHQLQKTYEEVRSDPRVESEEQEARRLLPPATASALRRLQRAQRMTSIGIVVALIVNTMVFSAMSSHWFEPVVGLAMNLTSSAIVGLLVWFKGSKV